jgi:RNA-directed DNA polymerase
MFVYALQEVSRGHSTLGRNSHRGRSEFFNLRSSQFKIRSMEQQQAITYQGDLFTHVSGEVIRPYATSEAVSGAQAPKTLQVEGAGEQGRALVHDLMGAVLCHSNIKQAYKQVKSNKGVAGIDQMPVGEFATWYAENEHTLISQLNAGNYQPQGVKQVEIPKPNGGKRKLGIPTVTDRIIQQAIAQVLSPIYERKFSDHSYGFRPNRGAHQALKKGCEYVDAGRLFVVDIDLKTFFDVVNHDRLMYRLSQTIGDKTLLGLIRKYLQSGIMVDGVISQRTEGTPQGSPLSPLLSNIVLDELDDELERRGHKFVRYADDCNIYVRSQSAGERVMESISNFIEGKLKLIVNREKSQVCQVNQTKFLGYTIQKDGFLSIAKKSVERFKEKVRTITKRNRGVKFEQVIAELEPVMRGWLNYFHCARCRSLLKELDSWIRRKLRCYRLKQCKRAFTLKRFLEGRGVVSWQSWILALSGKGHWRKSGCPQAHQAMSNKWFDEVGLYNLTLNYDRLNN